MAVDKPNSALLILGHGSTVNPESSHPCWQHADAIKRTGQFSNVYCAFWKEEPSFRQVWPMIEEDEVYVVPDFISEGYFTREVLPRELEIEGHTTLRKGKTVHYCDPVGSHISMAGLITKRAQETAGSDIPPGDISLIVLGHGTKLNSKSSEAIENQVAAIRNSSDPFAEVVAAYMDEPPYIADWQTLTHSKTVVAVPFFIADGLHTYEDIPALLGIESEPTQAGGQRELFHQNPHQFGERTLYYSASIGTDPSLSEVIVDQVAYFDEHYRS